MLVVFRWPWVIAVLVASSFAGLWSDSALGAPANAPIQVVAAENFWGSIASQLGGTKANVVSVIVNPSTDPHDYEPSASDARTFATGQLVIVNGIGYDNWASQLTAANPVSGRVVLDVGDLLGLQEGDNPHQWYDPTSVQKVINAIVADYDQLDPADKSYFAGQKHHFETVSLAIYNKLRAEIRRRFAGVAVGYSESIFQPLGQSLGLRLLTPYSFAKAVAEGTDVSASDIETVDRQAEQHLIKVWVFNSQNVTPEVQQVNALAGKAGIPIATVTETLSPASASFEQWQDAQLEMLLQALHRATGR